MYKTVWNDLEKTDAPETVTDCVSSLESRFINEDCQLLVEQTDDTVTITLQVFNDTREDADRMFENFEKELQRTVGYSAYDIQTTTKEATASLTV